MDNNIYPPGVSDEEYLERVKQVIVAMSNGTSLREALESAGIAQGKFFEVVFFDDQLSRQYLSAQLYRAEAMVEDMIEIADTEADPMRARVRIDTRRWYASKIKPQKFGDKIDVNINQAVNLSVALEEARKRIDTSKRNVIDISPHDEDIDIFS